MPSYRLRPRYRGLAWGSIGLGGALATIALWTPAVVAIASVCGLGLGAAYLFSPTWRLKVVTSEDALAVFAGDKLRFTLPWSEVVKVVASASTKTCFVDGGAAERRILIPGDGAPAPYRIERRDELYDEILARVPAAKVEQVALLSDRMED
jgi:hypothetical protein